MECVEPRIQYATTTDGMSIAFAVSGSGPVLLSLPAPPDNHAQLEWQDPSMRENIEGMARHRTLVRFDGRGTGLSTRNLTGYSLTSRLLDLEAVVAKLGVEEFAIVTGNHGCQLAFAYAAANPDKVTHIIAVDPFLHGADFLAEEQMNLMSNILEKDFDTFTQMVGALVFGWGNEEGPRYSDFFRKAVNQSDAKVIYDSMREISVSNYLARVTCPTLVISRRSNEAEETSAQKVAAGLPNGSLRIIHEPAMQGGSSGMRRLIGEFLGERWDETPAAKPPPLVSGVRTILFTDVEDHSGLMQRLGDKRGRDVLRDHERITRQALKDNLGTEVKAMGDGFMVSFGSAQRALDCAVDIQRAFASKPGEPIHVRIGINAGEPIVEDEDLFGTSVITAARIAAEAAGREILVSDVVRQLVAGKGYLFSDRGTAQLKGLDEPVAMFELGWQQEVGESV
jgi:class 3 adenylate cyclase/pimeloyl-ACP methyl ester carboxylesterase